MKSNFSSAVIISLVFSMLGLMPSQASGALSISFPSGSTNFPAAQWTSVATNTGTTPGISGGSGGTISMTVDAGSNGLVRLSNQSSITAAAGFNLASFNGTSGGRPVIVFTGLIAAVNTAIGSLEFKRSADGSSAITVEAIDGDGLVHNGHYYRAFDAHAVSSSFTSDPYGAGLSNINNAMAARFAPTTKVSSSATIECQGYLPTITSASEQGFITSRAGFETWLGATDNLESVNLTGTTFSSQAEVEGKFHWLMGPNRGEQISNNNVSTDSSQTAASRFTRDIVGMYQNWDETGAIQPDNSFTDGNFSNASNDFGVLMLSTGYWHDRWFVNVSSSHVLVEYGGVRVDLGFRTSATDLDLLSTTSPFGTIASCTPAIVASLISATITAIVSSAVSVGTGAQQVSQPASYTGPVLKIISRRLIFTEIASDVSIQGLRLGQISRLLVDGVLLEILAQTDNALEVRIPPGLTIGSKNLVVHSPAGTLTYQAAFFVDNEKIKIGKISAGTFDSRVAIFARDHDGKRLSVKIGGRWFVIAAIPQSLNNLALQSPRIKTSRSLRVLVYLDRVLVSSFDLKISSNPAPRSQPPMNSRPRS